MSTAGEGVRYPQLLRDPRGQGWWRSLLGLLLAGATLAAGSTAVIVGLMVAAWVAGVDDPFGSDLLSPDQPLGLLANNLVLAMLIPACVLAVVTLHRVGPGALASVVGRPRWGLLLRWLVVAAVVVAVTFAASFAVPVEAGTASAGGDPARGGALVGLLVVIVLTTPLQAAAEEVGFRGYLTQAVAAWFSRPLVGSLVAGTVSAIAFALAHGAQDPWLFGDRLAFGAVASWLAWRTGGLEAAVALHVANNMVSLGYTALTGSLEAALAASELAWQFAVVDLVMLAGFAAVVHVLAGRWGVGTHGSGGRRILWPPGGVGYPGPRPVSPPPAGDQHPWGMG